MTTLNNLPTILRPNRRIAQICIHFFLMMISQEFGALPSQCLRRPPSVRNHRLKQSQKVLCLICSLTAYRNISFCSLRIYPSHMYPGTTPHPPTHPHTQLGMSVLIPVDVKFRLHVQLRNSGAKRNSRMAGCMVKCIHLVGDRVWTADDQGVVRVHETSTSCQIRTFTAHDGAINWFLLTCLESC